MNGLELFLVRPRPGLADANEQIADHASRHGGLILMATQGGALIIGMPTGGKQVLDDHPLVGFVGGVTLNQDGKGAEALRQRFALNAARQLVARQQQESSQRSST